MSQKPIDKRNKAPKCCRLLQNFFEGVQLKNLVMFRNVKIYVVYFNIEKHCSMCNIDIKNGSPLGVYYDPPMV